MSCHAIVEPIQGRENSRAPSVRDVSAEATIWTSTWSAIRGRLVLRTFQMRAWKGVLWTYRCPQCYRAPTGWWLAPWVRTPTSRPGKGTDESERHQRLDSCINHIWIPEPNRTQSTPTPFPETFCSTNILHKTLRPFCLSTLHYTTKIRKHTKTNQQTNVTIYNNKKMFLKEDTVNFRLLISFYLLKNELVYSHQKASCDSAYWKDWKKAIVKALGWQRLVKFNIFRVSKFAILQLARLH